MNSLLDEDREFQHYYAQHLQPLEHSFESLRQDAVGERNRRLVAAVIAWLAAIVAIGILMQPLGEFWPFLGFFAVASLFGLGIWVWLPAGAHEFRLKDQVLSRIVPYFGDLEYQSEPTFKPDRFRNWLVLPFFAKSYEEDQIEGSYHGVPLRLAEISLRYEKLRRHDDHSSTSTAFKGLLISFELDQAYPGVTLIRSQGSDMNRQFQLDDSLAEVNVGFDFEVYATADAPGITLADSRFLERLSEVSDQFEARHLFASFHKNQLVMLIDHKEDFFEMSHRQETNFAQDADRVQGQLGRIFAIVDLLELTSASAQAEEPPRSWENLTFPALPGSGAADAYDVGGWGCLGAFIIFAISLGAYLWLLDSDDITPGAYLWWSGVGSLLMALGLFQILRSITQRAIGTAIFGLILLAGALAVLYYYVPSETLGL